MLYITNTDTPGVIGALGNALAANQINIAQFHLGRQSEGEALALVSIDAQPSAAALAAIEAMPQIHQVAYLNFG